MNNFFLVNILPILEESSCLGELKNEMETRLIGHSPNIAPKAYLHVVYAPLDEKDLREFQTRIGRLVPDELNSFFQQANGIMIFSGKLRVMGYVPLTRKSDTHIYNYPSNIIIPNVSARIKGLSMNAIVVGFYQTDGSYASIEDDGCVVRFDAKGDGRLLQRWDSFNSWLLAETKRLQQEQPSNA